MNAQVKITDVKTPFGFTKDQFNVVLDIHKEFFPEGVRSLTSAIYDDLASCYLKTTVTAKDEWRNGYSDNDKLLSQIEFTQIGEDQYTFKIMRGSSARVEWEKDEPHEVWENYKIVPLNIADTTGTFAEIIETYRKYEQARFEIIQNHGHLMG